MKSSNFGEDILSLTRIGYSMWFWQQNLIIPASYYITDSLSHTTEFFVMNPVLWDLAILYIMAWQHNKLRNKLVWTGPEWSNGELNCKQTNRQVYGTANITFPQFCWREVIRNDHLKSRTADLWKTLWNNYDNKATMWFISFHFIKVHIISPLCVSWPLGSPSVKKMKYVGNRLNHFRGG